MSEDIVMCRLSETAEKGGPSMLVWFRESLIIIPTTVPCTSVFKLNSRHRVKSSDYRMFCNLCDQTIFSLINIHHHESLH